MFGHFIILLLKEKISQECVRVSNTNNNFSLSKLLKVQKNNVLKYVDMKQFEDKLGWVGNLAYMSSMIQKNTTAGKKPGFFFI